MAQGCCIFQFQNGAIKVPSTEREKEKVLHFNSKMVQLKYWDFNKTIDRVLVFQFQNGAIKVTAVKSYGKI